MKVFKSLDKLPTFKNAIVTIGTFDGVHVGHQKLLNRIKELALANEGESVLITFDPHPRFILQPDVKDLFLLNTLDEKIALLELYGLDNLIVAPFSKAFSEMPALEYIKDFLVANTNAHTIVIGYDHRFGKGRVGDIHLLKEYQDTFHYQVEEISKETLQDIDISSTKIRTALQNGDIKTANALLGHAYTLSGTVVKGQQIGRSIGFPTANINIDFEQKLIPGNGVYVVSVENKGKMFKGMLNIGVRPTLNSKQKSIEVNIFDLNEDLYGAPLKLSFLERLRDEVKFENITALQRQLERDKIAALNYLSHLL